MGHIPFTDLVTVNDIVEFAKQQGWTTPRPVCSLVAIDGYCWSVRMFPRHGDALDEVDNHQLMLKYLYPEGMIPGQILSDAIFLTFSNRRISTYEHGVLISRETQRKWKRYVKEVIHRRKEQWKSPQVI